MSNLSFGAGYWKKQLPLTVLSYLSSFIAIVTDLSLPLLTAAMLDYAVCYDPSKAAVYHVRYQEYRTKTHVRLPLSCYIA